MTSVLTPQPRGGGRRAPDHSGIRLPLTTMRRRFVPEPPGRPRRHRGDAWPFGGPPLRAA
jgi:hypothetical protein